MIRQLFHIGFIKTLWFNFRYLPLKEAIYLPVILARDVQVRSCRRGFCSFIDGTKIGILRFGFGDRDHNYDRRSSLYIQGRIELIGKGIHAFGPGTCLRIGKNGVLRVGSNFTCSVNNRIYCSKEISIGDDNMWSFDNVVMDTDSHLIYETDGQVSNPNRELVFGNHVWVGCRNIILKGSNIPSGCIVASGSVITKRYDEEYSIITSNGKVIKKGVKWSRASAFE